VYPFQEALTEKIFESNSADENGRGKLPRVVWQELREQWEDAGLTVGREMV